MCIRDSFQGIPRFAPEHFCRVILKDPMRRKQLDTGLSQLAHEGVIQLFYRAEVGRQDPWLGAVGQLQFEVLCTRMQNEYNVKMLLEPLTYTVARWIGGEASGLEWLLGRRDYRVVETRTGGHVLLADSTWALDFALRNAPGLELHEVEPL